MALVEEASQKQTCTKVMFLFVVFLYLTYRFCGEYLRIKSAYFGSMHDAAMAGGRRILTNSENDTRIILFWNKLYSRADYGFGFGRRPFVERNCSECRCYTTADRSLFSQSAAVIFHMFGHYVSHPRYRLPVRVSAEQIYVMAVFESPLRMFYDLSRYYDQFNLTYSYLDDPDTDLYSPIGATVPRDQPDPRQLPTIYDIRRKSGQVAWVVSNCKDVSRRSDYVRELRKYISVHVYGKCGNGSCPLSSCFRHVYERYKFYLAFENSYCTDYVTEKVYRTLQYVIVPVVLGAANYSKVAPDGAVIDVRDFRSPRHLADYLKWLDGNDAAYLAYFDWKKYFSVKTSAQLRPSALCKLCEILHDKNYKYKTRFDPHRYWSPDRWCHRGSELNNILHLQDY